MANRPTRRPTSGSAANTKSHRKTWITTGIGSIAFIGLIILLYLNIRGPLPIRELVLFPGQQRGHVEELPEYGDLPPVGGEHLDAWQNCGIYTEPIDPGNAIHSLEHGAVWITYQPELQANEIAELQELVRGEQFIILSPYPGLRSPVVASAWQVQLQVDSAGDGRIGEFIEQYRQGLYTPERGASCDNGVGEPVR
jgi:hypothetical protein